MKNTDAGRARKLRTINQKKGGKGK